jgi:precorrin-6B methylase 2
MGGERFAGIERHSRLAGRHLKQVRRTRRSCPGPYLLVARWHSGPAVGFSGPGPEARRGSHHRGGGPALRSLRRRTDGSRRGYTGWFQGERQVPATAPVEVARLAKVSKDDVVYDLGSGDGRIVVTAAKKYQARGVGIELDPVLVRQARDHARQQGVEDRVTIKQGDVFATDFGEATVVTLYLLPHLNRKLLPKLSKLRPGTRIVSHAFPIEGIQPVNVVRFLSPDRLTEHTVYLYVTPLYVKKIKG